MKAFVGAVAPFVTHIPRLAALDALWVLVAVIPFSFAYFTLVERPFIKLNDKLRGNRNKTSQPQSPTPEMAIKN